MLPILIKYVLMLLGAAVFGSPFFVRLRKILVPVSFAFYVSWWSYAPFCFTALSKVLGNAVFATCIAYSWSLFDKRLFRQNRVAHSFLLFWIYMLMAMFLGARPMTSFVYNLSVLTDYIFPAYCVISWAIQRRGMWVRILKCCAIVSFFLSVLYFSKRTMDLQVVGGMRAGIDIEELEGAELNVNALYLMIVSVISWSFLSIVVLKNGFRDLLIKGGSVIAMMLFVVVLIRTGSRGAIVALAPIVLYLFFAKSVLKWWQRSLVIVVLIVGTCYSVLKLADVGYLDELRVFQIETGNASGDITTGRASMFASSIKRIGAIGCIIGGGGMYDEQLVRIGGSSVVGYSNGHSALVQIFLQSGAIGIFLFLCFLFSHVSAGLKLGARGGVSLFLLGMWVFSGIGESANIMRMGIGAKAALGAAIALCVRMPTELENLDEGRRRRLP